MKICFPIVEDKGLKSEVNDHFGSTKKFLVFDSGDSSFEVLSNPDADHEHGMCQPLKALDGKQVDVVIVGGLGMGALSKLQSLGINVYRAIEDSVEENLKLYLSSELDGITAEHACSGHNSCGH